MVVAQLMSASRRGGDEFDGHVVGVTQGDVRFAKALGGAGHGHAVFMGASDPVVEGIRGDRVGGYGSLTGTSASAKGMRPGEEGQDRARRSGFIPIVQVIGRRVVEVYRLL